MQKTMLQVESITGNALLNAVSDLLDSKLKELNTKKPVPENTTYITRQDVAAMFKITLPTVHAWVNAGILKAYKIGNKTRFLLGEVKAATTQKTVSHD